MAAEIKKYEVTDHQDNSYEISATGFIFDEGWLKFYDGSVIVAGFFQPTGFVLVNEE